MKNLILYFLLVAIISCCDSQVRIYDNDVSDVCNFTIDSILSKKIGHFDICGEFNGEFQDVDIQENLSLFDSIFTRNDIDFMLAFYNKMKGKNIDSYLDNMKYDFKKGNSYSEKDNLNIHFTLSPPMFTLDKDYCVIFVTGYAIRGNIFKDGFFFILNRRKESWKFQNIVKTDSSTPKDSIHYHDHSFIPKIYEK